jgi:WD40 repeat protein
MAFHPEPSKPLIFAGDKLGNLGIFDASQTSNRRSSSKPIKSEATAVDDESDDESDTPNITSLHLHTRTITTLQFSPLNPSHLYTSSYDSSIRLLDLSTSTSTEIYGPADTSSDEPLSGLEIDPATPHILYFSRLDGHVGRYDTRAPAATGTAIWELSEKKIGGFSIHPQYPHFLATASLDRHLRLWDLRRMGPWEGEGKRPACVGEHVSRLSVSHAAFNAVGQVATASYDDTVKIHSFEGMGAWKAGAELAAKQMEPSAVVRHNNQTGRWVTMSVLPRSLQRLGAPPRWPY